MSRTVEKCYPAGGGGLRILGYVLLGLGVLVLFVCIPCWVWLALLGVVLMAAGWLVLKLTGAWR